MQTERKYKIDKYIELARLTKSADKKEEFIDWAHYYLELSEAEFDGKEPYQTKIPYLDGKEKKRIPAQTNKRMLRRIREILQNDWGTTRYSCDVQQRG